MQGGKCSLVPGRGDQRPPDGRHLFLHLPHGEGGGIGGGSPGPGPARLLLPEGADVAAEGLQEGGDVDLLEGLLAVVHGGQDVLGADVVGLLQAAVHT